jgi:ABC-type multidrug transport system ATPase subunit
VIKAIDLTFGYKTDGRLLNRLNFSVSENARLAVLGENGSGKTSLLRIIAGSENRYTGEITSTFTKVSFIPTSLNNFLLPWYSVKENIAFFKSNGKNLSGDVISEYDSLFKDLMPKYSNSDFFKKKIYEMSSGQKAVLSIICSLSNFPDLLILDETFSNLSVKQTDLIIDYLKKQALTIIFTSHSNRVVDSFCTSKYNIPSNSDA